MKPYLSVYRFFVINYSAVIVMLRAKPLSCRISLALTIQDTRLRHIKRFNREI